MKGKAKKVISCLATKALPLAMHLSNIADRPLSRGFACWAQTVAYRACFDGWRFLGLGNAIQKPLKECEAPLSLIYELHLFSYRPRQEFLLIQIKTQKTLYQYQILDQTTIFYRLPNFCLLHQDRYPCPLQQRG